MFDRLKRRLLLRLLRELTKGVDMKILDLLRGLLPALEALAKLTPTPIDDEIVAVLKLILAQGNATAVLQACKDKGLPV